MRYPDEKKVKIGDVIKLNIKGTKEWKILKIDETEYVTYIYVINSSGKTLSFGSKAFLERFQEKLS